MNQITESDASVLFQNSVTMPPNQIVRREAVHLKRILYERENKKGLALIFNHFKIFPYDIKKGQPKPRSGTEIDCQKLKKCFLSLNFHVKEYHELTHIEIQLILDEVAQQNHANTSCVAVVLMTHGDTDDIVLAADKKYHVSDLWQQFEQAGNPTLRGKPKLFFIQACRGDKPDDGIMVTDSTNNSDLPIKIPTRADYLIMYSTVEDSPAYREDNGSWFISALCQELLNHASRDLLQILTAVNYYIAYERCSHNTYYDDLHNKKQMPQIVSMLTKHLFFD